MERWSPDQAGRSNYVFLLLSDCNRSSGFECTSMPTFQILPRLPCRSLLWYSHEFGDYLFVEKSPFFIGLMWLELLIQWPLSILNLYSICRRKSWFNTTCLVYGLSAFTTTVAILADMIISSKLTDKLMIVYFPFAGFDVLAILRSLLPYFSQTRAVNGTSNLARKKRA
ncbi:unnamed protein product [Camellia sinensis]